MQRLKKGHIQVNGEIEHISDHGTSFHWNARGLPGAWVMKKAITCGLERISDGPVVTISIANCSHIGALVTYFNEIVSRKLLGLMAVTNPAIRSVAPFGGTEPILTTNPIGFCIPTHGSPILVDLSTSATSNAEVNAYAKEGNRLPDKWLIDAEGLPTDDPRVITATPPGSIMPVGGERLGYKGFGMGIFVEAFALALSGYGRNNLTGPGGQGVFLQLIDPNGFGGLDAFLDETTYLAETCRNSKPAKGVEAVRLPGDRALQSKQDQLEKGIQYPEKLVGELDDWCRSFHMPLLSEHALGDSSVISR